jgi:hypothetical protein
MTDDLRFDQTLSTFDEISRNVAEGAHGIFHLMPLAGLPAHPSTPSP